MKGQSAIEYLTTYGWMAIAVTLVGSSFYTTVDTECTPQIRTIGDTELSMEDVAVTKQGLEVVFKSASSGEVEVDEVNLTNKDINRVRTIEVDGDGTSYVVSKANTTEGGSCQTINMQVAYDTEYINNLDAEYELELPVTDLENLVVFLRAGGGEIPAIESSSTLKPTNETICFGGDCPVSDNSTANSKVERSGDTIFGTIRTKHLEIDCVGGNCESQPGSFTGFINRTATTVDGTLWVKGFKPVNKDLCIGGCEN